MEKRGIKESKDFALAMQGVVQKKGQLSKDEKQNMDSGLNTEQILNMLLARAQKSFPATQGNIQSASNGVDVKSLLLTSCYPGEGKTFASICLARSLAEQAGAKVLLLDGNFCAPKLHEFFSLPREPGLYEVLTNNSTSLESVLQETEVPNLSILTCGAVQDGKSKFLHGAHLGEKINELRASFDYLIFDGTAAFGDSAAFMNAKYFDAVLLLLECERTKIEVARLIKDRIARSGGNLLGVILNKRKFYIPRFLYRKV